ncbi:MAG: class I SAM-dependent methyltransferase [Planctomycetes bacterium]|nr:class I SAM-dependent methyltransferase [Planctomycetota bacterium]
MDNSVLYDHRFSAAEVQAKQQVWKVLCEMILQKYLSPSDKVLDIACGYGDFLNHIKAKEKYGIDLGNFNKNYLNSDIQYSDRGIEGLGSYEESSFDVIFMSNFLEHLPNKRAVEDLLKQCHSLLKPQGSLLVLGPNVSVVKGRYWDYWDHHVPISDHSMDEALNLCGYETVYSLKKFLPYTTKLSLPKLPIFVKIYLSCPWVWKILGEQFFIQAKKKT